MSWFRSKSNTSGQWSNGAIGAAGSILLGLCFLMSGLGDELKNRSYDLPFKFRPDAKEQDDAVIVYMDDRSATALNLTPKTDAWKRDVHAQLITNLMSSGVKAIVFDVLWTTNAPDDQQLAGAMRAFTKAGGKVVVASSIKGVPPNQIAGDQDYKPVEPIRSASAFGFVEFPPETDRVIRRQFVFKHYRSMAWKAAELLGRAPQNALAKRWLNFYGPPKSIANFSYFQLVPSNTIPREMLSNKVVYVGAESTVVAGGTSSDEWPTPYTASTRRLSPGVEFQATAFLNLIRNESLTEFSPFTEFLLSLFVGAVFGFGLVLTRPWIGAAIAVAGFFLLGAVELYLVWNHFHWFPWLIHGVVQIPAALGWAALVNTRKVYHEKELLEQTLATARAASASAGAGSGTGSGPVAALNAINQAAEPSSNAPTMVASDSPTQLEHVIGDHELIRSIGKGAYGEVWLGKSLVGIYRAVKVVYRRSFQHAAPFEREFRGLKKFAPVSMSYGGFVQILHVGKNDREGYFYYIMELGDDEITGPEIKPESYSAKNLAKELKKRGGLPVSECLAVGIQLAAALEHLHKRELIHRDIKPSNIIFVHGVPKLADIGLVTALEVNNTDATYVGTPGYIAPEGPGSRAADIFSLGKVLYECSMGRDCQQYPELPSSLLERPEKDELLELNKVISKACDPDPRCRYKTAAELHGDLVKIENRVRAATI